MRLLVTGGTGFVGKQLISTLVRSPYQIRCAVRSKQNFDENVEQIEIDDIANPNNWDRLLKDVDVVLHLAARPVLSKDKGAEAEINLINTAASIDFAKKSALSGVNRFVFLSTIKVNGEDSGSVPFCSGDKPRPEGIYALSKFRAEEGILQIQKNTKMETVIVRPPMVYGPGAKGNFQSLVKMVQYNVPLPLGGIQNKRSLISVYNLSDFLILCAEHPDAKGRTFLVSDTEDVSTSDLLRKIARVCGKEPKLLHFPAKVLKLVLTVCFLKGISQRLFGSLQINMIEAQEVLGWRPKVNLDEGLRRTILDNVM